MDDGDNEDNAAADDVPQKAVVVQQFETEKSPQFSSPLRLEPDGMNLVI